MARENDLRADASRALVLRYLAAFGPATAADAQNWSGLARLAPTFEALRPQLRVFTDGLGRELFDVPEGPIPSEDTPAPVRFIPDYDNLILSHADRSRVISVEHRKGISVENGSLPSFLIDGQVVGSWKLERKKKRAVLTLTPFIKVSKAIREELRTEGEALVRFAEPDATELEVNCLA